MPRRRLSESDKEVLRESRSLVNALSAESLSLLNPGHEDVIIPFHREGHVPKKKRGGQLTDYSAIEVWIDLKQELHRHNARIDRVYALYFYLKRLVNA
jgi:hypothetical protein